MSRQTENFEQAGSVPAGRLMPNGRSAISRAVGAEARGASAAPGIAGSTAGSHVNRVPSGTTRTRAAGRQVISFAGRPEGSVIAGSGRFTSSNPLDVLKAGMADANSLARRRYPAEFRKKDRRQRFVPELGVEVVKSKPEIDVYYYRLIAGTACRGQGCSSHGSTDFHRTRRPGLVVMRAHMHAVSATPSQGDITSWSDTLMDVIASPTDTYEEWIGVYTASGPPVMRPFRKWRRPKR